MKTALAVASIVIGGAAVGLALERTGVYSPVGEPAAVMGLHEVAFSPCPGHDPVGFFRGGDRVFVTGRSADAAWFQVRSPFDVSTRVWIEASYATPDSDVTPLPVAECDLVATAIDVPAPSTTSSSTSSTTSISTTSSSTTMGTSTSATTTTTRPASTTTTTTTTTVPGDTEGPTLAVFQSDEAELWEDGVPCAAQPRTMLVGGYAEDPSGVESVWISWSVGSESGTRNAGLTNPSFPGFYFAEIGPFPTSTLGSGSASIWLEMVAYDDSPARNQSSVSSSSLTVLNDCSIG